MVELGNKVRDIYTGFEGTAVARTTWLHGCARILIEPRELKKGELGKTEWFDEQRVEVLEAEAPRETSDHRAGPGGPQCDPVR